MTAVMSAPVETGLDDVSYTEKVISWNVKMMLTAYGLSQTSLAEALGIQRAAMSKKLKGVVSWSVADLVRASHFLNTSPESLMDDSLMRRMGVAEETGDDMEKSAGGGGPFLESTPRGIRTHNPRLKRTLL